jgi:hypothetical protein
MNTIFKTVEFNRQANKVLSSKELLELNKFSEKLKINSSLRKPLSYGFLREKKISSKRIYYLVYNDICIILFVAVGDKKKQQATIDNIKLYFNEYKEYVYQLYEKLKNEMD